MLVLTRRVGEWITVFSPDGLEVLRLQVTRIDRDQVRIGFDAPPELRIVRDELLGNGRADGYVERG